MLLRDMAHPSRSLSGRMSVGVQSDPTEVKRDPNGSWPCIRAGVAPNYQIMRPICDNGEIIFGQLCSKTLRKIL